MQPSGQDGFAGSSPPGNNHPPQAGVDRRQHERQFQGAVTGDRRQREGVTCLILGRSAGHAASDSSN